MFQNPDSLLSRLTVIGESGSTEATLLAMSMVTWLGDGEIL